MGATFSLAMRGDARELDIRGTLTFASGAARELDSTMVMSYTIEEGAANALLPGTVLSAAHTLELANERGQWISGGELLSGQSLAGATVQIEQGVMLNSGAYEYQPLGVFIVSNARSGEGDTRISLTGNDSISTELSMAFSDDLTYPATLAQIWAKAVSQTRYIYNGTVPNGNAVIDKKPDWNGASMRQAFGNVAMAAGCFVQVSRLGSIELVKCWNETAQINEIGTNEYLSMSHLAKTFGPLKVLRVSPVRDGEDASQPDDIVVKSDASAVELSANSFHIADNPLFFKGESGLKALAEGTMSQLSGMILRETSFRWRGDPTLRIGDRIRLTDTRGNKVETIIEQQTLAFDVGFSSQISCAVPAKDISGVPRVITPEGGVNASALVGAVDGKLLAAESITAYSIAAKTITSEHIAAQSIGTEELTAGSITAEKLDAVTISAAVVDFVTAHICEIVAGEITTDELYASIAEIAEAQITTANISKANIQWAEIQNLAAQVADIAQAQITTANIENASIDWAAIASLMAQVAYIADAQIGSANIDYAQITNLSTRIAEIAQARIDNAQITTAQILDLETAIADITNATIATADIDWAHIKDLVTDTAIITQGVGGELYISKLAVTEANMVSLTVGELIVKGADGNFYAVGVGENGDVTTTLKQVENANIADGTIDGGMKIIEKSITADVLNVNNIFADSAIVRSLIAKNFDVNTMFALEATISQLNALDIRGNKYMQLTVQDLSDATSRAQAAADANASDMARLVTGINGELESLQAQVDGSIMTWFYEVAPTEANVPTVDWATTEQKNIHLGDLYYDTVTGYCYRWQVLSNAYSWQRITDTDVTKALEDASKAQDTADQKRRVFVVTPVPPYDIGDMWMPGVAGNAMYCKAAKIAGQSYSAGDWATAVGAAESAIAMTSEQIALTVKKTEYTTAMAQATKDISAASTAANSANSKIDSLQIGGRNLIRETRDFKLNNARKTGFYNNGSFTFSVDTEGFTVASKSNIGQTSNVYSSLYSSMFPSVKGDNIVISTWMKVDDVSAWDMQCPYIYEEYDASGTRVAWNDVYVTGSFTNRPIVTDGAWVYVTSTHKVTADTTVSVGVRLAVFKNGSVSFKKAKIEFGNKATDWSPAPEDIDQQISDLTIHQGATAPVNAKADMLWLDTSSGIELKRYTYVDEDAAYSWITVSDGELSDELESQYHDLLSQIQAQRDALLGEIAGTYETKENVAILKREMQSAIEQETESIWLGFRETTTELVDANGDLSERVSMIESGVTVEPGAKVTLSASNASTRMEINPNGLKIADKGGASLAEFTSDGATVPRIRIGEQMSLGNLMWTVHANGTSSIMAN